MHRGQTLIFLLVFMVIIITVSLGAVMVTVSNSQIVSRLPSGLAAYSLAESGAEEALMRLLRDPGFSGTTLTLPGGTATISVTGSAPKVILSVGNAGNFTRQVRVQANYVSGILNVTSWREVY